jgi:predicted peptidase
MDIISLPLIVGVLLMAKPSSVVHIEPGKQLPQTFSIHSDGKTAGHDSTIRYLLFVPKDYEPNGKAWPLMLFLHGLGECSDKDLPRVKIHGPPHFVDTKPDFPFVLVTPQLPPPPGYKENVAYTSEQIIAMAHDAWKPRELIQLVDHVVGALNVDRNRVYVTGLSMGGYGTWSLVAAYPDRFAAALPICGGGEPDKMARALSHVPIWAFHGAKDTTVPLEKSQQMVDAVKRAGGDVKLTVYPKVGHDSWKPAYDDPKVYEWLLSHQKAARRG